MRPACVVLIFCGLLAQVAGAQRALTNQDVVTLARAGFSEQFLVETILAGPSHFDTSAAGLAELAKQGLNERVIRAMAGANAPGEGGASAPAEAAAPQKPVSHPAADGDPGDEEQAAAPAKAKDKKVKAKVVKPTRIGLAIATDTPYFESSSLLFGLVKKQVRVGPAANAEESAGQPQGGHGGSSFYPVILAPGAGTRYVVIP